MYPNLPRLSPFFSVLSAFVFTIGCNQSVMHPDQSKDADSNDASQTWKAVEHDFGLITPGVEVKHKFPVHNSGTRSVTIRRALTNCSCTVAEVSSTRIAPGGCEYVTVRYKPGELPSDDRRQVVVIFEETWAHPMALIISAKIRSPLTLSTDQIAFGRVGQGHSAASVLEIQNFSENDWNSIVPTSSAKWLTISTPRLVSKSTSQPRQVWQLDLAASAEGSAVGERKADLTVVTDSATGPKASVRLSAEFVAPVIASPGQLFFGEVKPMNTYKSSTTLFFSLGHPPPDKGKVIFEHSLGNQLRLEWKNNTSAHWELEASLTPVGNAGLGDETLSVRFPEPDVYEIRLPIYASVKSDD